MLVLITIFSIIGAGALAWVLFQMIQPGQLLGRWQNVLDAVYVKSVPLAMLLGHCYKCFAHFIGIVSFGLYLIFQHYYWWVGWWNILIYLCFVPCVIVWAVFIDKQLSDAV